MELCTSKYESRRGKCPQVEEAFVTGQAHDYYGLIAIGILAVLALIFKKYALWFLIAILMITSATCCRLVEHGWTH